MKMVGKSIITLFIILTINISLYINGEENFFKVPLEVREKNRPRRLVDDVNDPDMMKLKSLQDKFFSIVGNSSLGREFKSFNQLLHLLDSEAGIELGRLFLNGIMIGIGKEQPNQLLTEFLDDFQYRVSPDFADALVDYADFIKTVDLKMIPLTIEMLFKKDALGNSLAQLPLGQLVDLIQPEASKYGVDVRSFINGIVGKGDSTFPEMVRKMIHNFNITSLKDSVIKSFSEELGEMAPSKKHESGAIETKRHRKDQTLMLFKPLVAKLLKENEIDLEADAVIQVMTPFINSWGHSLQNMFPALQNNGKDFNFAQLLPLLGLFTPQMKKTGKDSQDTGGNILEAAMSLMQNMGKDNKNMDAILNLASNLVGNDQQGRKSKTNSKTNANENAGVDMAALITQMAQGLAVNSGGNEGLDILSGLTSQMTQGSNIDTQKIMEMASNLIGGIAKTKKDFSSQQAKTRTEKQTPEKKKVKYFPEALEQFLLRIQADKKCHTKIKDAFGILQYMLSPEEGYLEELKTKLEAALQPFHPNIEKDLDTLFFSLSYSQEEWDSLFDELMDKKFKENLVTNTLQPVTELVLLIISDEFQKQQNLFLKQKSQHIFSAIGLKGVTLSNFPERLKNYITMMSRGWDLPVNLETLLEPLRNSLKETWPWYLENVKTLKSLPKSKVETVVAESLKHDVANPVSDLWKISQASQSSSNCLPHAICQLINEVPPGQELRLLLTRFGSIFYGGIRAKNEDDFLLFVQVARAAVFKGNCEKYFPIQCPKEDHFTDEEEHQTDEENESKFETHQEL